MNVNSAIASIGNKMPDEALEMLRVIPKKEWNPYEDNGEMLLRLATADKSAPYEPSERANAGPLLDFIFEQHPPQTENEKKIWVDCCKAASVQGSIFHSSDYGARSVHEWVFLSLWEKTKGWMTEQEQFQVGCEVFSKRHSIWSVSSFEVASTAQCDWNNTYSQIKDDNVLLNESQFRLDLYPPLYWVQNKDTFEKLVKQGAKLDTVIEGRPLHEAIQGRPVNSFESASERRAVLSWLDKEITQEITQEKAWERIRLCRQASDVDRLLKETKKEWPTWRGVLGETMLQHLALFQPEYLWKALKRPECSEELKNKTDHAGRGLGIWLSLGFVVSAEKIKFKESAAAFLPKKDSAELVDAALGFLDLSKEKYWGEEKVQYVGAFGRIRVLAERLKTLSGGEICHIYRGDYSVRSLEVQISEKVINRAAKEVIAGSELGKRLFENSLSNVSSSWARSNVNTFESTRASKTWLAQFNKIVNAFVLTREVNVGMAEYVYDSIIQKSFGNNKYYTDQKSKELVYDNEVLKKVFESNINPEKVFDGYAVEVKNTLREMGWDEKIVYPWQNSKLKTRANMDKTISSKMHSAL